MGLCSELCSSTKAARAPDYALSGPPATAAAVVGTHAATAGSALRPYYHLPNDLIHHCSETEEQQYNDWLLLARSIQIAIKCVLVSCLCLQKLLPPGCNEPPNLDLTILMDVPGAKAARPQSPLRSKSPDAELAALVSAIQANNSKLREVEHMMDDTTHKTAHLQVRSHLLYNWWVLACAACCVHLHPLNSAAVPLLLNGAQPLMAGSAIHSLGVWHYVLAC